MNTVLADTSVKNRHEEDFEFLRDNDSLYALPLRHLPLETGMLKRCKLVKTNSLGTALEMFRLASHGRGFFLLEDIIEGTGGDMFGWQENAKDHPDFKLLERLATLHSYDVFNLRIKFRQFGIDCDENEYLRLSDEMKSELQIYMRQFTLPLIKTIFGDGADAENSDGDIVGMFRNPGACEAQRNIEMMSEKLRVKGGTGAAQPPKQAG